MKNDFVYPAIIEKDGEGYFVKFFDLECMTYGENLTEAVLMAKDVLEGHIEQLLDDDETLPRPTPTDKINLLEGQIIIPIVADSRNIEPKQKPVKKTLTIPYWLDKQAKKQHINFSGVLQEALQEKLMTR